VNTFLLVGAMTLTAHYASGRPAVRPDWSRTRDRLLLAGVVALVVIGASGALNALGDTLFPADSVIEGIREEFGPTAPFLLRLRTVHPLIAIAGGAILFMVARAPSVALPGRVARLSASIQALLGVQLLIGLLNVALLTPLEIQVLHLLVADALWVLWVIMAAEVMGMRTARSEVGTKPA
jgi:heme A synthase